MGCFESALNIFLFNVFKLKLHFIICRDKKIICMINQKEVCGFHGKGDVCNLLLLLLLLLVVVSLLSKDKIHWQLKGKIIDMKNTQIEPRFFQA